MNLFLVHRNIGEGIIENLMEFLIKIFLIFFSNGFPADQKNFNLIFSLFKILNNLDSYGSTNSASSIEK